MKLNKNKVQSQKTGASKIKALGFSKNPDWVMVEGCRWVNPIPRFSRSQKLILTKYCHFCRRSKRLARKPKVDYSKFFD